MKRIDLAVTLFWIPVCSVLAQDRGVINHQRVPPNLMYHRVWMVTPLVGSGTANDPKRPMFAPGPTPPPQKGATIAGATATSPDRSGVLGYQMQLSDDGKSALVEFVFASPSAFQGFLKTQATALGISVPAKAPAQGPSVPSPTSPPASPVAAPSAAQTAIQAAVPGLLILERGKTADQDVLTTFQKYKKDFAFGGVTVRPQ